MSKYAIGDIIIHNHKIGVIVAKIIAVRSVVYEVRILSATGEYAGKSGTEEQDIEYIDRTPCNKLATEVEVLLYA